MATHLEAIRKLHEKRWRRFRACLRLIGRRVKREARIAPVTGK